MSTISSPPTPTKLHKRLNSLPIQPWFSLLDICKYTPEFTQVHSNLIKFNLIQHPLCFTKLIGSSSISSHTDIDYAKSIFNQDKNPNAFVYNVMIRGYAQRNRNEDAILMYYDMLCNGNAIPNNLTYPFVIKACTKLHAIEEGKQVHGHVLKLGLSEDLFVGNSLVSLYMSFGLVGFGYQVFDKIPNPDVVSWNTMISGLVELGSVDEARLLFDEMPKRNLVSWNCMIDGYAKLGGLDEARGLFDQMGEKDLITWNSMIGGYVESGLIEDACALFERMPWKLKDLITFNIMIDGYAREGRHVEVMEVFEEMNEAKIEPNRFTLVSVLTACSTLLALDQGKLIDAYILQNGVEVDAVLGTAIVEMFAKCGLIDRASTVFENMKEKDVAAWNSMIHQLGLHGRGKEALSLFSEMLNSNTSPDEISFLGVLSACRHAGLVDEGKRYFQMMSIEYSMAPRVEHYGCMIDILCRADLLEEARDLIEASGVKSNIPIWGALLGASSRLNNVSMGEYAAKHLIILDPSDSSCHVALSNIYSATGMHEKAIEVRKKLKAQGLEKVPGCSFIEMNGVVHEFTVGTDSLQ